MSPRPAEGSPRAAAPTPGVYRGLLTLPGGQAPIARGRGRRLRDFVRPYLVAAAGAARLFAIGWSDRRRRGLIIDLAERFGHARQDVEPPTLPVVRAEELAPGRVLVDVREAAAANGNVDERELLAICRIARANAPSRIFEFGTFDGRTTLNLAANAAAGARVHTLDLPAEAAGATAAALEPDDLQYVRKAESGTRYRGSDLESAIEQLYGDSATFDYAPYVGAMDFVFVDASHAYDYVINDSLRAIELLGALGGTILWHDYARWPGVTRALHELRRLDPRFAGLRRIDGTTLAVLRVSA